MSLSLFTSQTPTLPDVFEASPVTVGITLTFSTNGTVSGARVYGPTTVGVGTYEAALWRVTVDDSGGVGAGTLIANATFGAITPGVWNNVTWAPVAVDTTHAYVIGLRTSQGRYAATGGMFASAIVNSPITGVQDGSAAAGFTKLFNGRFTSGLTNYPNSTFGSNGYFIDVLFDASEQILAANLTATGSLTAPLTAEARIAANLTGTGSMTAALTTEAQLAATLAANGSLRAPLVVPTGPVDPIGTPVAQQLLACLTEQLQQLPSPPAKIQLRVGRETGPLIGPNVDECCAGLAWIRVVNIYPSWDSFPGPDNTWLPCGPLAYAVVLEMGTAFCMPWSDSTDTFENIDPPSEADWSTAFTTQMQHQTLMRRAAACCWLPTQRRAVGEWVSLPVEGGCTGGTMQVTVSVPAPCADC